MGEVVGATIQTVLENLLSIAVEEFNLFRYFKKDLEKLKGSVLMIQDFLYDAEKKQVTEKAVKRWLKNLETVAFEADNVFDELNYQLLRNKMENKSKTWFTPSNPIVFRLKMARKIKDINEKLKSFNQDARDLNLQVMKPVGARFDAIAGSETDSFTDDPNVRGREDDVSRIVENLTASPTEQVFSILPIVGMGGLGKTTLARLVFQHEKVKAHFDERIWVYVSQTFDAVNIFKKMLESLTTGNNIVELGNREAILKKLQPLLGSKRYLLVLDDVWNEGSEKWDDFLNSLFGITFAKGNGIIVTTRGQNVASIVKTLPTYELEGLPGDECWSIIKSKAFIQEEVPSDYETIGRNIAKRCQGLPLAAKVVGGLLRNKSKDEWLSIEETWLSKFGEGADAISKVLRYSFDQLSLPSLKKCFAYCSIFPKGFSIEREQLIELWMAEGFLTTDQSNDLETSGNKFCNLLAQNSLLQVVERGDDGNITTCYNMHDLVHDLASSVLGSKSNGASDKSLDDIHQIRYVAESCPIPKDARCVRTLIFHNEVSDNMFQDFKSLHVLVLQRRDVRELPSSITRLIHLRLLDISYTRIESLPEAIGKLYHLQTLRTITPSMPKLPNTLKNLISLRHLHIPSIELPPEIGRLTCLQTLRYFKVGNEKGCRIGELGSLKDLKGELKIGNLERVVDKEEAKSAHLIWKQNISKLKFAWNKLRKDESNDKNVLEGLQPHPNLKSLKISGFKGKSFPSWTLKMEVRDDLDGRRMGLGNLMEITLKNCRECKEIPMLGQLPHLKSLCLNGLTNVRSIGSSFYGIDNDSRSTSKGAFCRDDKIVLFPALERFELIDMPNLKEWEEVESPSGSETQQREIVVFPCLEDLTLRYCHNLTSAPCHFPRLKELEINQMESPLPLAIICGSNLTSLTKLHINGVKGLVCLPDVLFSNNQNLLSLGIWGCPNLTHLVPSLRGGGASLKSLRVGRCPNLRELPNDLPSFSRLKTLHIHNCPNLKSIPYQGLTSLRELGIRHCEGLTNLASEMIESFSPSLESLDLMGLTSLTNPHMVIGHLQKLPRLTDLTIVDVPGILDFSKEIGSLHNLQRLDIALSSSDSLDYRLVREVFNNIFKGLHSLQHLRLGGYENWDSLPDQLQCFTALSEFWLTGFGIEALPEWLGNMSSLREIFLEDCTKLRCLPSKEAMQRLTKLTLLNIRNCPLLNVQRCSEQQSHDSQWPKISHILEVYVNGREI